MLRMCWAPVQTFSQSLANLAGTSNKRMPLQWITSSNNIAGQYKQQSGTARSAGPAGPSP